MRIVWPSTHPSLVRSFRNLASSAFVNESSSTWLSHTAIQPMTAVGQTRRIDKLPMLAACPLRPESDRRRSKCDPSLCARSDQSALQQTAPYLLDHLVGQGKQPVGHVEVEGLCGL